MRLFVKDDYIDFEAPIQMTEDQRTKFINFMQNLFENGFTVKDVEEKTKEVGERETTFRDWVIDEYCLLLGPLSNDDLAKKLNRSSMSVRMQRGDFVPGFLSWAKNKGYTFKIDKELVEEFLKERGKK